MTNATTQLVIMGPKGRLDFSCVEGFQAKPRTLYTRVRRIDGALLSAELPAGWEGSFHVECGCPGWDDFIAELSPRQLDAIPASYSRVFAIRAGGRLDRACASFVAMYIHAGDGPPDKAVFARVAKIVRAIEKGAAGITDTAATSPPRKTSAKAKGKSDTIATDDTALAEACAPIILSTKLAREPFDRIRADAEKEMVRIAKQLPVWGWADGVRGLAALGVAIIAAEASGPRGDVGSYATKERLWKRLGLAVIDGARQRQVTGDEALLHGYNPRRRAEVWTIADSMFRHQWAGATEDMAAHPVGPYGDVYMRRKAAKEGNEWPPRRREADARRVMTKALLEDYWRVWRGLPPLEGKHDAP